MSNFKNPNHKTKKQIREIANKVIAAKTKQALEERLVNNLLAQLNELRKLQQQDKKSKMVSRRKSAIAAKRKQARKERLN